MLLLFFLIFLSSPSSYSSPSPSDLPHPSPQLTAAVEHLKEKVKAIKNKKKAIEDEEGKEEENLGAIEGQIKDWDERAKELAEEKREKGEKKKKTKPFVLKRWGRRLVKQAEFDLIDKKKVPLSFILSFFLFSIPPLVLKSLLSSPTPLVLSSSTLASSSPLAPLRDRCSLHRSPPRPLRQEGDVLPRPLPPPQGPQGLLSSLLLSSLFLPPLLNLHSLSPSLSSLRSLLPLLISPLR